LRIILVGGGEVGFHLSKILSREGHQVVLVEPDKEKIMRAEESLDIMVIEGSGSSVRTLMNAGIEQTDLVIAVSASDEVNILACMLAEKFGVAKKIARIRNEEYTHEDAVLTPKQLGIDLIINPELETANEIVWLIRRSAATDVIEFADGAIQLMGLRLDSKAKIASEKKSLTRTGQIIKFSKNNARFVRQPSFSRLSIPIKPNIAAQREHFRVDIVK